jgi:predicted  nucleic acid-binding Zn-ribbon protein
VGDKDRRRAGDDTRARIDDLAGGWDVPGASTDEEAPAPVKATPPPERPKRPSATPPPPPPARAKPPSGPPPPPPPRAARPPVPPTRTPTPAKAPPPAAPPGIGHEDVTAREDKLDPETLRAETARGETEASVFDTTLGTTDDAGDSDDRDDATRIDPRPPTAATATGASGRHQATGSVRAIASLPRRRGLGGDMRYVWTVLFGVARSRRELQKVEAQLTVHRAKRKKRLIELAARVLADDDQKLPGVAVARERLAELEEDRSRHTGQAAAAETESAAARRDHENDTKRLNGDIAAIDTELADLDKKMVPLEKEAQAARKKATELKVTLERIEKKIASTEASVVNLKGARNDRASVDAELATLRADRVAVQRDEPAIAAELDELLPRIAELESRRAAARERLDATRKELTASAERLVERLGVVGAHQKVIDRALAESQVARDRALADLGERLVIERPRSLGRDLADIDTIDADIAGDERRVMELHEVLGSIDKGALARGIAVLGLAFLAAAALAIWLAFLR